jgi:hypothetical protein
MRLGPLNALLTALESDDGVHARGHFLSFPNAPIAADTNVHCTESFGRP